MKHMMRLWRFENEQKYGTVRLRLLVFTKETAPKYIALSYVWGGRTIRTPARSVVVNGHELEITKNLSSFLLMLRHDRRKTIAKAGARWFFADQISMDQENISERNHQVSLMGDIYSGAYIVFAWLGHDRCLWSIHEQAFTKVTPSDCNGPGRESLIFALRCLVLAKYWKRLWVVQELFLAKEIVFWYCEYTIDRPTLLSNLSALDNSTSREQLETGLHAEFRIDDDLKALWPRLSSMLSDGSRRHRWSLQPLLQMYAVCECADPRDKIFALQALVEPSQRVQIDYSMGMSTLSNKVLRIVIAHKFMEWPDLRDWTAVSGDKDPRKGLSGTLRIIDGLLGLEGIITNSRSSCVRSLSWANLIPHIPIDIIGYGKPVNLTYISNGVKHLATTKRQKIFASRLRRCLVANKKRIIPDDTPRPLPGNLEDDPNARRGAPNLQCYLIETAQRLGFVMFGDFLCHADDWLFEGRKSSTLAEYYAEGKRNGMDFNYNTLRSK